MCSSLVLVCVWSLVDPPALPLVHYGKREVRSVVSSMEGEYNAILTGEVQQVLYCLVLLHNGVAVLSFWGGEEDP